MNKFCRLEEAITHADGRTLVYADIGREDVHPAFYFYGFPGSQVEARFFTFNCTRSIRKGNLGRMAWLL